MSFKSFRVSAPSVFPRLKCIFQAALNFILLDQWDGRKKAQKSPGSQALPSRAYGRDASHYTWMGIFVLFCGHSFSSTR
jgi:hypothetical protein